jgi:hypothetical protein
VKVVDSPPAQPPEQILVAIDADIRARSASTDVAALSPAYAAKSAVLLALHRQPEAALWARAAVEACLPGGKLDELASSAASLATRHDARRLALALLQACKVPLATTTTPRETLTEACAWAAVATQIAQRLQLARALVTEVQLVHSELLYQLELFEDCIGVVQGALKAYEDEKDTDPWLGRALYTLSRVLVKGVLFFFRLFFLLSYSLLRPCVNSASRG